MARLLIIVSSARSIDLVADKAHPTGYFADEVLKPYDKFMAAGVEVAFATVDGAQPQFAGALRQECAEGPRPTARVGVGGAWRALCFQRGGLPPAGQMG